MKRETGSKNANSAEKHFKALLFVCILCVSILAAALVSDRLVGAFQPASKLVLTASPSKILSKTGSADVYSFLTVQLQDANGNPALAPSSITITLSTSNASIVALTASTFTIPAGQNYARSTWYYTSPASGSPFAYSTYIQGKATITATASGLTSGSVTITTTGAVASPSKLYCFAQPSVILADKSSISYLIVQLLDSSSNPAIAASNTPITLSLSDPSILTLTGTSLTITAGTNYVAGYYSTYWGNNRNSYCTSTYKGGSASITANSTGLQSSLTTIKTVGNAPSKISITAAPNIILTGGSISYLTVQLLDAGGNPALAQSDVSVNLSNSNSTILTLTGTSLTITAGTNYVAGYYSTYWGNNRNSYCTSTYMPGSATITASATGLTSGSVKITTTGAIAPPSKIAITAQPVLVRADGRTYSFLTVQLQDTNGKPAITQSARTISLKTSNPGAVTLTGLTFTIPTGQNYARSTWYYTSPASGSPFAQSTLTPGTSTITANSTGLTSGSVTISSSELISLSASIFNKSDQKQSIFNAKDTTRIGATVYGVSLRYVTVTIKNPSNATIVNNATMTPIGGKSQYNYKYDYVHANASPGKYYYVVTAKDAAGHTATKSGNFYVMSLATTSNGPWSVSKGGYYNASYSIGVKGATAKKLTLHVDLPYWHAIAFAELAGQSMNLSSTTSPYSQHKRWSLVFQNVASGRTLQIKLTIITANNAATGSKTVYYHSEWTTTENYAYSESTITRTVTVT